jgi:hypothetical protein
MYMYPRSVLQPGSVGRKMLVGISNTAVILLFKFVLPAAGFRIAPLPELLYEFFPFFVGSEFLEGGTFFIGDDVECLLFSHRL